MKRVLQLAFGGLFVSRRHQAGKTPAKGFLPKTTAIGGGGTERFQSFTKAPRHFSHTPEAYR
ncbi:hypothetical protein D3C81_1637730 [compost metagenome]